MTLYEPITFRGTSLCPKLSSKAKKSKILKINCSHYQVTVIGAATVYCNTEKSKIFEGIIDIPYSDEQLKIVFSWSFSYHILHNFKTALSDKSFERNGSVVEKKYL